jgi:hypothetical protein
MRVLSFLVTAATTAGLIAPVMAQMDPAMAQKKLLSRRAAEADAYRKLAETVRGLQITSDTYVRDFVAESDQIRAGMDTFIRGVRLGEPHWYADMSCEVPAEVTVQKVIETLQELHQRYYKGHKIKAQDFQQITRQVQKNIIKAVGMGAPREDLPPDLPEGCAQQLGGPPIPPQAPIPPIWSQMPPQARLLALRAAEVDAKRKLLERIKGLRITSDTQVRDFVAESDQITAQAQGTIIGATIVKQYLHSDEPIAEVTVEVPVESVIECIKELHNRAIKGHQVKGSDITEIQRSIQTQTFQATGMGVPRPDFLRRFNTIAQDPADQLPPWAMQPISATGNGVAPADKAGTPQGRLLAARAAELDAKRKLAEQVNGLRISSQTLVRDFVTQRDEIRAQVQAVLLGAGVEKTSFDGDTATVVVSLPGMAVWDVLHDPLRMAQNAPQGAALAPPGPAVPPPAPQDMGTPEPAPDNSPAPVPPPPPEPQQEEQ